MKHPEWLGCSRTAVAIAVAVVAGVVAAPALAQNTTSGINGVVTGADGKPVAGARVTIVHVESGSSNSVTTDAEGRYAARGLRAGGPYTVTITKGSQTDKKEDLFLSLAESFAYDAQFSSGAQVVTITGRGGSDLINKNSMGAGTSLGTRELASFGSIQRSLQDYARTDPRLVQTDKDRSEVSAVGQNPRYNSITIDGVRVNDTFGLEANGLPTIKQPISIDAIQAVQVNVSNYDVTQQGYTGANINAVTKSGTNDIKGSVYYVYRNDDMSGDRFFRRPDRYQPPPVFKDSTIGFTLGGPIIKDRLFFFVGYEELKSNRNAPIFGPIGSGLTEVGITPAQVSAAQAAATARGFDIGTFSSAGDLTVKDTLVKVDWNISDSHRASLRYSNTEEAQPIFPGFSSTTFSLSSRLFTTEKKVESIVGQLFSDWTQNFSTELKLSKREYLSVPLTQSDLPEIQLTFTTPAPAGTATGNRTMRSGTEETRHFNRLQTDTSNVYLAGSLSLGAHDVKLGADIEQNEIFNAFVRRAKGQYTFEGADPVALFVAGNPTAYRVQVPRSGFTLNDAAANINFDNTGLFLQDTWTVNKQLTLMGGVRVDTINTDSVPIYNAAAQAAFGYDNRTTVNGQQLVQPRLGFNYRLNLESLPSAQVRGGVGLFQGSAATVWLANPYQNTGMVVTDFSCSGTGATRCPAGLFTADTKNPATVPGAAAANVDFLAPGTGQPSVYKANLAFDADLPIGVTVGAEFLHTRVNKGLFYRHLNLGNPTATSPDGRQMFWNAGGRNSACWDGNATPLSTGACATSATDPERRPTTRFLNNRSYSDVTVVEETTLGSGNALTLSVSQSLRALGVNWNAAFTRTTAKEVSPLTSSTAFSQWANRANFNPNENVAANSASLIRNRINASVSWSRAFMGSYKTSLGVFYEGREGRPYSWTFNNDMNGDGISGNDLLYVPTAQGSGEVLFRLPGQTVAASGAAAETKFWEIVNSEKGLNGTRGGAVSRTSGTASYTNIFDLRLSQEVPGFFGKHKGVLSLDIFNFGNLLNKKWGRIDEMGFSDGSGGNVRRWINFAGIEGGKMVYSVNDPFTLDTKNNRGESAWAAQITVRYEF